MIRFFVYILDKNKITVVN